MYCTKCYDQTEMIKDLVKNKHKAAQVGFQKALQSNKCYTYTGTGVFF